jgi:hypothetical protein
MQNVNTEISEIERLINLWISIVTVETEFTERDFLRLRGFLNQIYNANRFNLLKSIDSDFVIINFLYKSARERCLLIASTDYDILCYYLKHFDIDKVFSPDVIDDFITDDSLLKYYTHCDKRVKLLLINEVKLIEKFIALIDKQPNGVLAIKSMQIACACAAIVKSTPPENFTPILQVPNLVNTAMSRFFNWNLSRNFIFDMFFDHGNNPDMSMDAAMQQGLIDDITRHLKEKNKGGVVDFEDIAVSTMIMINTSLSCGYPEIFNDIIHMSTSVSFQLLMYRFIEPIIHYSSILHALYKIRHLIDEYCDVGINDMISGLVILLNYRRVKPHEKLQIVQICKSIKKHKHSNLSAIQDVFSRFDTFQMCTRNQLSPSVKTIIGKYMLLNIFF